MDDPDEKAIARLCAAIREDWPGGLECGHRRLHRVKRIVFGFDLPRRHRLSGLDSKCPGIPQPPKDKI